MEPKELSDVFSHLFDRDFKDRSLFSVDSSVIRHILETMAPHKLKISTLKSVFDAFFQQLKGHQHEPIFDVYFAYDDRRWLGIFRTKKGSYDGNVVQFINIKLPNDGFFYTRVYEASPNTSGHELN